jgi:trehalose synthase
MGHLLFPELSLLPLERYQSLIGAERMATVMRTIDGVRARLTGRAVWNVSSSAVGGGVAEMVRSLLAYARGAGVDARWAVIQGPPEFFALTKRLHNALHGTAGDGSALGERERQLYERVVAENAAELSDLVRPRDIVIVHDPQPAAMVAAVKRWGAHPIWRCHVGHDESNSHVEQAWKFLAPYLRDADAYVFSRAAYVPPELDRARAAIIPPSVDPFSTKNQRLSMESVHAILAKAGILDGVVDPLRSVFVREDGTPGRVDRAADVVHEGPLPVVTTPLVVQVSRWDRLKDPLGVLYGFARLRDVLAAADAYLILAGPSMGSVADDPEGKAVYESVVAAWRDLPERVRTRAALVSLPTADVDENAAMVNALQRQARVIVQKSLHEGFGLTVTEAMWKARPVVASAVGGIRDQIEDGVQGILLEDPRNLDALAAAIARLLADPTMADRMGAAGRERVLERYLGIDSLLRFAAVIEKIDR